METIETPSNEIFDEMRKAAIEVWETYDNEFGYASEKIKRVNSITNIQDNAMSFYRMFDHQNQIKMTFLLSDEAKNYILENN